MREARAAGDVFRRGRDELPLKRRSGCYKKGRPSRLDYHSNSNRRSRRTTLSPPTAFQINFLFIMSDEANAPATEMAVDEVAADEAAAAGAAEETKEEAMEVEAPAAEGDAAEAGAEAAAPAAAPAKAKKAAAPKKAAASKKKAAGIPQPKRAASSAPAKAPAAAAAAPAKPAKAKKAAKSGNPAHPTYLEMVVAAIEALKERNGSSRQAILKYILATYNVGVDPKVANTHVKQALKRGITTEALKNTKVGTSFHPLLSHYVPLYSGSIEGLRLTYGL